MARILGPDPTSRRLLNAYRTQAVYGMGGQDVILYLDQACTQLASIAAYQSGNPATPGATISGSRVELDSQSQLPLFWFPDGVTVLWAKPVGGGKPFQVIADVNSRFAAVTTTVTAKTAAYTLTPADSVVTADATTAGFAVTLPSAAGIAGKTYQVKRVNAGLNAVTVATTSSQTIDGASSYVLRQPQSFVEVISDGRSEEH